MRINRTEKLAELITSFDPTDDFESSLIGRKRKKCLFVGKFTTFFFEICNLRDLRQMGFFNHKQCQYSGQQNKQGVTTMGWNRSKVGQQTQQMATNNCNQTGTEHMVDFMNTNKKWNNHKESYPATELTAKWLRHHQNGQ